LNRDTNLKAVIGC